MLAHAPAGSAASPPVLDARAADAVHTFWGIHGSGEPVLMQDASTPCWPLRRKLHTLLPVASRGSAELLELLPCSERGKQYSHRSKCLTIMQAASVKEHLTVMQQLLCAPIL